MNVDKSDTMEITSDESPLSSEDLSSSENEDFDVWQIHKDAVLAKVRQVFQSSYSKEENGGVQPKISTSNQVYFARRQMANILGIDLKHAALPPNVERGIEEAFYGKKNAKSLKQQRSSDLHLRDDPFAAREGKTLLWRNVNMVLVRLSLMIDEVTMTMLTNKGEFSYLNPSSPC